MAELKRETEIVSVLGRARVVAVLGAHREPQRPAFYVPDYLHAQGYRVLPVHPRLAGQTQWGSDSPVSEADRAGSVRDEPVVASLAELTDPVDLVDVFRPSHALDGHLADFLAMRPPPRVIWFQLGIRNDRVAAALVEHGFDVVQDRCTLADHRRFRASGLLGQR